MKKIGLISLALVMALGGLGVGYAAWTDSVTINGSVSTGDVDLNIEAYSCTYVWKLNESAADPDDMVVIDGCSGAAPLNALDAFPNDNESDLDPVAYAVAKTDGDDKVRVDVFNAFPLNTADDLKADFLLHYEGSIPVRVTVANLGLASGDIDISDVYIEAWESNAAGEEVKLIGNAAALLCKQLHYCDYVLINIIVAPDQAEQANDSNKSGVISGTITVQQWNEVVCP